MPVTVGIECRVDMSKTPLNGKLINNPDQDSIAYVTMHGIPHQNIDAVNEWLAPYRAFRNERNDMMCKNIEEIVRPFGLSLDFERDVLPLSNYAIGGSVTERHITFALSKKITANIRLLPKWLIFRNGLNLPLDQKKTDMLLSGDKYPQYYEYDILGILKSNLVERFYVKADKECPDVRKFIDMVEEFGGISAYPYLGDVGDSVTGDKKAQKFEDDYLDELMDVIKDLGFNAVTYMPTRNSPAQLDRIMSLCEKNNFFQISGEDINSPRQSFICKAYEDPKFFHLADAAFTLIDYENAATENIATRKFIYI